MKYPIGPYINSTPSLDKSLAAENDRAVLPVRTRVGVPKRKFVNESLTESADERTQGKEADEVKSDPKYIFIYDKLQEAEIF